MPGVVAYMQPGEENALCRDRRHNCPSSWLDLIGPGARGEPENSELAQLFSGERIGGARIAPAHIPSIFREHRLHVFLLHLMAEHGLIEVAEFVLVFQEE